MDFVQQLKSAIKEYDNRTRLHTFECKDEVVGIVGDNLLAFRITNAGSTFWLSNNETITSNYKKGDMIIEPEIDLSKVNTKETVN